MNEVVRLLLPKFMIPDIQEAFTILDYKKRGTLGPRDVKVRVHSVVDMMHMYRKRNG